MLVSNGHRLSCNPMRYMGGPGTSGTLMAVDSGLWMMKGARNNFYAGEATVISGASIANKNGFPVGNLHPNSWVMPIKPGGMGSRYIINGVGAFSGAIAGGKNATATLAGVGALTATGQLVVSAVATIAGVGSISAANLLAVLQAVATINGVGALTANRSALANMTGSSAGVGSLTGTRYATGRLEADITPFTELSPTSLAAAVWSALAASYNEAGTMGAKMNSAASAGDPWTTALPGSYASGEAGNIVGNMLSNLLDNSNVETGLTVRQALRVIAAALAGKVSGASGTTVTFRNAAADSKDRIVATVDTDGNRSAVTLDLT